jgi:hypothetical protein
MANFPGSPLLVKGGIVLIDPNSGSVQRIIALQYNPDTLSRTLQVQGVGEKANPSEALRLKGPAIETFKVEAEIDATDQLEVSDQTAAQVGLYPQLAVLETLIYPASTDLISNNNLAQAGTLEIIPMEKPLTLFIWSRNRIVPVRFTDFSVTEEAFDPMLNPIRVKVSLGMRVLSVDDLGFDTQGGNLFMAYLMQKEQLATRAPSATLSALGINSIP